MVTSWRHRLSSLYCESTKRKTTKKTTAGGHPTTILEQHDSWNHSKLTNILPCHFVHVITIVNITCGACKNIVTHPIEILSCKKLTCRDCCLNLVCKKKRFHPGCDQNFLRSSSSVPILTESMSSLKGSCWMEELQLRTGKLWKAYC